MPDLSADLHLLRAAGTALLLDTSLDGAPVVLHWGADPGDLDDVALRGMAEALVRPVGRSQARPADAAEPAAVGGRRVVGASGADRRGARRQPAAAPAAHRVHPHRPRGRWHRRRRRAWRTTRSACASPSRRGSSRAASSGCGTW
nr:hypothetical protein [Angustibacter aerolatus]